MILGSGLDAEKFARYAAQRAKQNEHPEKLRNQINWWRRSQIASPGSSLPLAGYCLSLHKAKYYRQLFRPLNHLLTFDRLHPLIYEMLSDTFFFSYRNEQSLAAAKRANLIAPDRIDAAFRISTISHRVFDVKTAKRWLKTYEYIASSNGARLLALASLLHNLNDFSGAENACRKLLAKEPNSANGHLWLARILWATNRRAEGEKSLETAISLNSNLRRQGEILRLTTCVDDFRA